MRFKVYCNKGPEQTFLDEVEGINIDEAYQKIKIKHGIHLSELVSKFY